MPTDAAELALPESATAFARTRPPAARADGARFSWWLWPHLLSLDAPLVAVVWQAWWARSARVGLPGHAAWILGLGVWAIYLADRLADTAAGHPKNLPTPRHAFHAHWRRALLPLALLAAGTLAVLTPLLLARPVFLAGLALLGGAGGYFWLIHNRRFRAWQSRVPKEAVVGGLFAVGTAFFPWSLGGWPRADFAAATVLFGGLCACNCALITRWERTAQDRADPVSLLNAFPRTADRLGPISLALAGVAGALWGGLRAPVFAPLLASGVLLAGLDLGRRRVPVPALRVLADAALLTPLLAWLW